MDERKLHEILGQDLEVPDMVNKKLREAYALVEQKARPAKWRGFRPLRTVLIAAATAALLCGTATAAYQFFRQDVAINIPQAVQVFFGDSRQSWERTEIYDEVGHLNYWPKREVVSVDPDQAQALVGDCLPESGYQWQIGDYTFTVEGYLLDETTGSGKFYYSVEHPGGFPEGTVDEATGCLTYKGRIGVVFSTKSDVHWPWISGKLRSVDMERSTAEKLYITEGGASGKLGWKAEDGLNVKFTIYGETDRDDDILSVTLDLPGVKSVPVITVSDPETGELAAAISPIAVRADARHIIEYLGPNGERTLDSVRYVALEYADGSRYVIEDTGLDNADYGMYDDEVYVVEVFNRLVDPSQVTAVIVDNQRYEVK